MARGSDAAKNSMRAAAQDFHELSPARQRTLDRLVAAARELASRGGYAAVTMHMVAQQAGVSRITAYKYFSNKDHLLAAVVVAWSQDIIAGLEQYPPSAGDAAEQVAQRFERVFDALLTEPQLLVAVLASSASPEPEAVAATAELLQVVPGYIGPVLVTLPLQEQQRLSRFTGYLFHAILLAAASGRIARDQAVADFRTALSNIF